MIDKQIEFNFLLFKGKLSFKQFITMIGVFAAIIAGVSIIVFSGFNFHNAYFTYDKDPMKIETKDIKLK